MRAVPSLYLRARGLGRALFVASLLACAAPSAPRAHATVTTPAAPTPSAGREAPSASAPQRYSATGRVRSIPPGRAFVSIAHQEVPGFMEAMTMDFEPTRPGQLDGLEVGAAVRFTFAQTPDRRLLLDSIERIDEGR